MFENYVCSSGFCKKRKSDICRHLDYSQIQFPNSLGHTSEEEAIGALLSTELLANNVCDDQNHNFRLFLCLLYLPPCTVLESAVPPCTSVCHNAFESCSASLGERRTRWPSQWNCGRFPRDGLCSGSSIGLNPKKQISSIAANVDKSEGGDKGKKRSHTWSCPELVQSDTKVIKIKAIKEKWTCHT